MKKTTTFNRTRLSQAVTLACFSAAALPAFAGSGSCTDGANLIGFSASDTCYLDAGDAVTVTAAGSISSASNSGIWGEGGGSFGAVVNNGTIDADDHGIYLYGTVGGAGVINNGVIKSDSWHGIYLYQTNAATVRNTGTIYAYDSGIYISNYDGGAIGGTIGSVVNSGRIIAGDKGIYINTAAIGGSVTNSGRIQSYYSGIYINGSEVGGSVVNTGTISTEYGKGIYISDTSVAGNVSNSGTINATDDSGIYIADSTVGGNVTNSGLINADARGIYVAYSSVIEGNVTNTGVINSYDAGIYVANAEVFGNVANSGQIFSEDGRGLYVQGTEVGGSVSNSGNINSYAAGIYVGDGSFVEGDVANSGKIVSTDYHGVYVANSEVVGSVINSGVIQANYDGIYLRDTNVGGSVINSGTIQAGYQGIYISDGSYIEGNVSNSGLISVEERGIYVWESAVDGSVTNTGTILSSSGNGIYVGDSDVGGDVSNSGVIISEDLGIYVGGSNIGGDLVNSGYVSSTDWAGIYIVSSNIAGSVINSGVVEAYYDGIYVRSSDIDGDVINSGQITAGDQGLYIAQSTVGGSVINSGIIQSDYAGLYVSNSSVGGSIVNSGTIESRYAGLYVGNATVLGSVTNSGVIKSQHSAVYVTDFSTIEGSVTNSGLIEAKYRAVYIYEGSAIAGDVTNTGVIKSSEGHGLYIFSYNVDNNLVDPSYTNTIDGDIVNSGIIEAGDGMASIYVAATTVGGSVMNSGTLKGYMYVDGASATNDGLLATGSEDSYVSGDYTQGAAGTFRFDATSSASFNTLSVDGIATFAGTGRLSVDVQSGHTLVGADVLNDVVSAGTLTATGFQVSDNNLALAFAAAIDGNTVDLTVSETGLTTVEAAALASGQKGAQQAAQAIDNLMTQDPSSEVAFLFGSQNTSGQVASALEAVLPSAAGNFAQASVGISQDVSNVVNARQLGLTGVSSGDEMLMNKNVWLAPFGGTTKQSDRDGVAGYEMDTTGFAFGADGEISDAWTVGAAIAYAQSDMDADISGAQTVDAESLIFKLYGSYDLSKQTSINVQVGLGQGDNDSKRVVGGNVAKASYDSSFTQLSAELIRSYSSGDSLTYAPYVYLDYTKVDADGYAETGAGGFNLTVADSDATALILGVGVTADYSLSENLVLTGDVGLGYDTEADTSSVSSSLAGAGSTFTTDGIEPSDVVYNFGFGTKYTLSGGTELSAGYDFSGRQDYTDQYVTLKANWKF